MRIEDIKANEYNPYYKRYLDQLDASTELISGFEEGKSRVIQFFKSIPEEKLDYRYAADKWTVKEVFQHLIDTERIFSYRAFRIGRGDITSLAGFDQNDYILPSNANEKSRSDLLNEFEATRNNSITILKSLNDENLRNIGTASNTSMSARFAAVMIIGHDIWHMNIIKERYGIASI